MSERAPMSTPRVGSSSSRTRGRSSSARASSTFCALPPDSDAIGRLDARAPDLVLPDGGGRAGRVARRGGSGRRPAARAPPGCRGCCAGRTVPGCSGPRAPGPRPRGWPSRRPPASGAPSTSTLPPRTRRALRPWSPAARCVPSRPAQPGRRSRRPARTGRCDGFERSVTRSRTSRRTGPRRPEPCGSTLRGCGPTMAEEIRSSVSSPAASSATLRPSRRMLARLASLRISRSRCVISTMPTPVARSRSTTLNSRSAPGSRVVISSRISSFGSAASALASSTSSRSPGGREPARRRGSSRSPARSRYSAAWRTGRRGVPARAGLARRPAGCSPRWSDTGRGPFPVR